MTHSVHQPRARTPRAKVTGARAIAVALVVAASLSGASPAQSDVVDPGRPRAIFVGPPRGHAPTPRLDQGRTGTTSLTLPTTPTEIWRKNVGATDVAPAIDAQGEIVLALSSGEVVRLDASGKEQTRTRLSGGAAVTPPLLLADGTAVVMTGSGQVVGISPDGTIRFTRLTPLRGGDVGQPLCGTNDGGFVAAGGRTLVTYFQDGTIRDETTLPARVVAPLVATQNELLALLDDGGVYRVAPPLAPRRLGSFGATIESGFALANPRTAIAAARDQILALDLKTGVASVRFTVPNGALVEGPPTLTPAFLFATSTEGILYAIDRNGFDVARATVERVTLPTPVAAPAFGQPVPTPAAFSGRLSPPLVAGIDGTVAFVRATGRLGVVVVDPAAARDPKAPPVPGKIVAATESLCHVPIAVLPAGDRRLVAVCREGLVVAYKDADK